MTDRSPSSSSSPTAQFLPDPSAVLEALPDPFFAVDAGWRYTYVNVHAAATMGTTPEALLGRVLWECFPEALDTALNAEYHHVMRTRGVREFDLHYPSLDVWVTVKAFPHADGIAVHFRDVTERRRAEERQGRLLELTRALAGATTEREVLEAALAVGLPALGAYGGLLLRLDETGEALVPLHLAGYEADLRGRWPSIPLAAPFPANEAVRTGSAVFADRERLGGSAALAGELSPRTQALAALPLAQGGQVFGALVLSFDTAQTFPAPQRDFMTSLAGQLAQALGRAWVHTELTRERARLAAVLDQMPAAIWVAEVPSGRMVAGNSAISRILRHPYRPSANLAEYAGYVGFHPDGRRYEAHEWPLARTITTGQPVHEEIEMGRGDGTRGFVSYSSALIHDEEGRPALAVVTGMDVTELRELNATLEARVRERTGELHARHEELAAETAALQAFAHLTERVGRETDPGALTQAAVRVLHGALGEGSTGYYELEGGRWRQRSWDGRMDEQTLEAARAGFPETTPLFAVPAASGGPLFADGWRTSDNELAPHTPEYGALAVHPITVGGRTVGQLAAGLREKEAWSERDRAVFLAVGRALTLAAERADFARQLAAQGAALAASNHELRLLNGELEAFASSVSHDLRAPLRHIQGFAGLLRKALAAGETGRAARFLGLIETGAGNANTLVDELLSFARTVTQELRVADVDLAGVVAGVRADLAPDLTGREVTWRVGELPTVRGDRGLLRLVFANLLSNAVKYTRPREAALIEVCAEREEGAWVLRVRDNGVGFDGAYMDRLFGVFQRLHRADEFEGVGIGLANVKRIVARHGGEVWAEGKPGEGATFFLRLPREEPGVV
ncbi:ATP-binding protein [Deinococcus sp. YIM 134068]|uniref:ATP-binding protein n=1 Tax=Deinococcus lichenicola TaxID=3118910 RepID=UPI002F93415F